MSARTKSPRMRGILAVVLFPAAVVVSHTGCAGDHACNDGNPCTRDTYQSGTCRFATLEDGTDCEDSDVCNGVGVCTAGSCLSTGGVERDDHDACTEDECDPVTGEVTHPPIAGCVPRVLDWQRLSTSGVPSARTLHSAVWTGTHMIVWGGKLPGAGQTTDTGARYDPASDSWTPTSTSGAPSARHSHSAVWIGDYMLVWGGFGSTYLTDGALYDPTGDSWTPISGSAAPSGRTMHSAVWSGSELIVWGGLTDITPLGDGARYAPATDRWLPVQASAAPAARLRHMAVWSGARMIVWGGTNTFDWLSTGAEYDPASDSWSVPTPDSGMTMRESGSAIWSGDRMLVWGGWDGGNYLDDGASYDPSGSAWVPLSVTNAPATRARHIGLWTGTAMVVWAGCAGAVCDLYRDDGSYFVPSAQGGAWTPLTGTAVFPGRIEAAFVYTGTDLIVFGGRNEAGILGDAARAAL